MEPAVTQANLLNKERQPGKTAGEQPSGIDKGFNAESHEYRACQYQSQSLDGSREFAGHSDILAEMYGFGYSRKIIHTTDAN